MSEPFLGEVRLFGFTFAPKGWAFCDGQVMSIAQNTALFSLLGVNFGGDGRTTFALPNLQGRAVMHPGQGPGLTPRQVGDVGGENFVTLAPGQMPAHSHALTASNEVGEDRQAVGEALARSTGGPLYGDTTQTPTPLAANAVTPTGNGQPHNNMMPFVSVNFCIALVGVYPPRP